MNDLQISRSITRGPNLAAISAQKSFSISSVAPPVFDQPPLSLGQIKTASRSGYDRFPICIAKTPLTLSHDSLLKGRPTGFILPIQEIADAGGTGFLTAVSSGMQLLPGLSEKPAGKRWIWTRRQERSLT